MKSLFLAAALCAGLGACASWERSAYEGVRQGADNAARLPDGRAVPQTTRLPDHEAYRKERDRLRGNPEAAPVNDAAASSAAR